MRHLASPETQGDLDLVALLEEPDDRAHFHLIVVNIDVGPHLDLLDLDGALFLARLGGLLLRLVFVFAEIEDLAHRRFGIGRDLDQVETGFRRAGEALGRGDHADIVAGRVDKLDFWSVDGLVDAGAPPIGRKLRRSPYDVSSPLNERRLAVASQNGGFSRRGSVDPLRPFYSNGIAPDKSSRVRMD